MKASAPLHLARLVHLVHLARLHVEAGLLLGAMKLPPSLMRRLAGPPVEIEGNVLDRETQLFLKINALNGPGAEKLPIPAGRAKTEHDAGVAGGRQPIGETSPLEVGGGDGPVPARLYVPRALVGSAGRDPLLVFFHGGGWVYGSIDSHDASCRVLAEKAGVRVVSVDYRLAPEHPFPAAYDDGLAAYRWVVEHAAELGADPRRLAVGGDSAGGTLAATVALAAARAGIPLAFQLLVYPATDMTRSSQSNTTFAEGFFLTDGFMSLASESYLPNDADRRHPHASPWFDDIPEGLAPAYLCTAGFDPLRDEGEWYADKMREAGVAVEARRFSSLIHSFFNVVGVRGTTTRAAVEEIATALGLGLAPGSSGE